jgi:hypothetical protein
LRAVAGGDESFEGVISYGSSPGDILEVTESSPQARSVTVKAGIAIIEDADGNPQVFRKTASEELTAPANSTGSDRDDIVVAKVTASGSELDFISGTSVPSNALKLATVANPTGSANVVNADITDERTFF